MEDIFEGEWLEEKFVAGIVVGGDGLRVGVHHERLVAVFLQGKGGVDAAVVELDPLPDAVGSATEDHDFLGVRGAHLVVAPIVGGVVVRRVGLELGGAGVHKAIAGDKADLLALGADVVLGAAGEMGDLAIGESEGLGFDELVGVHSVVIEIQQSKTQGAEGVERENKIVRASRAGTKAGGEFCGCI